MKPATLPRRRSESREDEAIAHTRSGGREIDSAWQICAERDGRAKTECVRVDARQPDEIRKKASSRDIYSGDTVTPDSKAHYAGGGSVEQACGGVRSKAEDVDTVNNGHRERDQEQQ